MTKKIIALTMMFVTICLCLAGCEEEEKQKEKIEQKITGGDIIRYAICLEDEESLTVTLPIIATKKINTIKISQCHDSNKEANIYIKESKNDIGGPEKYEGYYIYYFGVEISCGEEPVDTYVDWFVLDIDGEEFRYETPYFRVANAKGLFDENIYKSDDYHLLISGGFTGLYGYISNDKMRKSDLILTCDRDITLKNYKLFDYLNIENCTLNGVASDSDNIDAFFEKEQEIDFRYNVSLKDEVYEDNIIRTSPLLTYEHEGQLYYWIYTEGYYIWKDWDKEHENVKRYIDKHVIND